MKLRTAALPVLLPAALALCTVSCLGNFGRTRPADDPFRGRGALLFPEDARGKASPPAGAFQVAEFAPSTPRPAGPAEGPPPEPAGSGEAGEAEAAAAGPVMPPVVPWENLEGGIWVLFTKPVVALGPVNPPRPASDGVPALGIRPALEGRLRWYGSRLLSFEPAGSLAPATEYVVSIDPQLESLSGERLAGMNAFRFRTPALEIVSLTPEGRDVPPEQCRELRLLFNFPVDLDTVASSLRLEAAPARPEAAPPAKQESGEDEPSQAPPRGRAVPFRATYDPELAGDDRFARRVVVLTPRRELPWNSRITVRMLAGARPARGAYGTAGEQVAGFTTLEPLALRRGEAYTWLPTVGAGLEFNHPIAGEQAAPFIAVDLPGYSVAGNLEVYGQTVELKNLPVAFESSFRVRVRAGLQDLYGQRLSQDQELELKVGPAASYANIRAEGDRILEAGFPPVVAVEFQNVNEGSYDAGPLADPFMKLPDPSWQPYPIQSLPRNTRLFRLLDLSPFLGADGRGSAFARWRFTIPDPWSEGTYPVQGELRLQVTDLGLTAHLAPNRFLVRVASLSTGDPVPGAELVVWGARGPWKRGRTDAAGVGSFVLEPGELARQLAGSEESLRVEVRNGSDRLLFRPATSPSKNWNFYGLLGAEAPRPATYMVTDRGLYRPGETFSYFGIDRDVHGGRLEPHRGAYRVELQRGWYGDVVVARDSGVLSPSGRFWGEFPLPPELEPDQYLLVYSRDGDKHQERLPVRVAFFRRVGFAVDLDLPQGEHYIGERLEARFSGHYLAGGDVTRGRWSFWWSRHPIFYSPPDPARIYSGFRFGDFPVYGGYDEDYGYYSEELSTAEGALAGDGVVTAAQELADGRSGRVYQYELNATIEDLDRQSVSRSASVPVFTSALLVGARLTSGPKSEEARYFVGAGEPFTLQACWVRPDGSPYPAAGGGQAPPLSVRLLREDWKMVRERAIGGRIDTRWVREEIEEQRLVLQPPGRPDARGRFLASEGLRTAEVGAYILELRGQDGQGREALTRIDFYSTGSANLLWRRGDERRIELVADRPSYAPGEKATLLIKSPLEGGTYLMTVEREGILEERLLELDGTTDTVQVEIREEHIPVLYVSLSGYTGRTALPPDGPDAPDLGKPRGVFGMTSLAVAADIRRIELDIEPSRTSYRPGSEAEVRLRARSNGRPVEGAEILLVAADRAVLDLIDYHLGDPMEFFYAPFRFAHGVAHYDSRDLLIDPVLWKLEELPGGDKEGAEAGGEPVPVRRDFRATAVFQPGIRTDGRGMAAVRFRLPDQLTRFRLTAVAVHASGPGDSGPPLGERFGWAEAELLVQNPVNVRPALPRTLRVGDRATAGVVVTNLDDHRRAVGVRLESDLLAPGSPAQQTLNVPPGESREVAFALAAGGPGSALLRFHVDSEEFREILENELPVQRSSVREAFTVVGQTETTAQEALVLPQSFLGVAGEGLSVSLDSTLASSLLGAIRFLDLYPYDCLEQRTSKLFAYVLYDWLLPDPGAIARELGELSRYQTEEGGMSFWADPGYRVPGYYVSLRSAHLLRLAADAGLEAETSVDVPALLRYLESHASEQGRYLQAYALYVLALYGRDVQAAAAALDGEPSASLSERTLLALAYLASGERGAAQRTLALLRNYFRVGTRSVTLVEPQGSWSYYGGELQAKALALMLYSRLEPDSQIASALADDLLASARRGYWVNTSTTGWVLQAFAEVMKAGGDRDAEFAAHVRAGGRTLVQTTFSGPSRAPFEARIEPGVLEEIAGAAASGKGTGAAGRPTLPVEVGKEGRGRLYYALSLSYALAAEGVEPRDEGIGLFTELLDRRGAPAGNALKLGELYRLHGVVYSSHDRDFLAVSVPLPAGAEPLDGSLVTTRRVAPSESDHDATEPWYERPVPRVYDNEVRLFYDFFPRGKREFAVLFRATTPGVFVLPPATAQLMYEEEVFGRTGGGEIRIEP